MTAIVTPAMDGRLRWVKVSKHVHQLTAVDGGTAGTVVLMAKENRYSGSTHRTYLGQFTMEQEARAAVEEAVAKECP